MLVSMALAVGWAATFVVVNFVLASTGTQQQKNIHSSPYNLRATAYHVPTEIENARNKMPLPHLSGQRDNSMMVLIS